MPSKSCSQHKLMEAAAHTKGGFAGVPQAVGKEFVAADEKAERKAGKRKARDGIHGTDEPAHGYGR